MPRGQPAEAIVVPHPEPYVRKQSFGSQRLAELRAGRAVFLAGYRRPGYYREVLAKEGLTLVQRRAEMPHPVTGEPVPGITIWVEGLKPQEPVFSFAHPRIHEEAARDSIEGFAPFIDRRHDTDEEQEES